MARFFCWSDCGDTLFLARRLQDEGHAVQLYIHDPAARRVGLGLVPRVPRATIPRDAIVLFDGVGHGAIGQQLRAAGHRVIGGHPLDRTLELDRASGTRAMVEHGIAVPETRSFRELAKATAFLEGEGGTWFFKPSGNQGTNLTHAGDAAVLPRYLAWALPQLPAGTPFELQRQVEGDEISCEGWFDGTRFVPPFNATIEDKRFLAGNRGPRTGCESNAVWHSDVDPLGEATVGRLAETLTRARYCGPLDCNMIVDRAGVPHGLEWSCRFGFDALQALSLLVDEDLGEVLAAFAHGALDRVPLRHARALTLRVTTPPYPVEDATIAARYDGLPLDPALLDSPRIFVNDVRTTKTGPKLAGRDGYVCCVGAVGDDLGLLRQRVLAQADALDIPEKQYRPDPVGRVEAVRDALRDVGLLAEEEAEEGAGASSRRTG